jgi:hypothetical protein
LAFDFQITNHKSEGLCLGAEESLYIGAVLHESRRNSVRRQRPKMVQLLVPEGIKNFSLAGCFTFSTVAQMVRGTQGTEAGRWRAEDRPPTEYLTTDYCSLSRDYADFHRLLVSEPGRSRQSTDDARSIWARLQPNSPDAVLSVTSFCLPNLRQSVKSVAMSLLPILLVCSRYWVRPEHPRTLNRLFSWSPWG